MRATHPPVPADQRGASAHRLGPRALTLAHWLHYHPGLPLHQVPDILETLTGIVLTQGPLTRDALRRTAGNVGQVYEQLRQQLPRASAIHTDDTGSTVGGAPAFLMVFTTRQETVFQIRPRHRNDEVREVASGDYEGVLITDRGRS